MGALALAGNAYAEGAQELNSQSQDSEKITTITLPSERKEFEGVSFSYDILKDYSVVRTDENQTKFLPRWYYDIDNDGKFGKAEEDMISSGNPVYMGDLFDDTVNKIYKNQVKIKQLETQLEQPLLYDEYNDLKSQYDSAIEELTGLRQKFSELEQLIKINQPINSTQKTESLPETEPVFPEYCVGLNTQKIAELAKSKKYQAPAMSEKEADRVERECHIRAIKERGAKRDYNSNQAKPVFKQYKPSKLELNLEVVGSPGKSGIDSEVERANISGFVGGRIGIVGKVNNWLKLGGAINGSYGAPETVSAFQTEPSTTGRYFIGSIENGKMAGLGADVEFYLGKNETGNYFLFGIGPNVWVYEQLDSIKLMNSRNEEMTSDSNNKVVYKPSIEAYIGLQAKWLRLTGGWDSRKGIFGGIGGVIPLSKE